MRIDENSKVVLEDGDKRYGNFVVTLDEEKMRITIRDVGGLLVHSYSTMTPKGSYLTLLYNEEDGKVMEQYISVMFNVLLTIPDMQMMTSMNQDAVSCMERHRDCYGVFDDEDEDSIIEEQKEMAEFIEKAKIFS